MIMRNCRSASSSPAAVQRKAISPDCQRLTLTAGAPDALDHRLTRVRRSERALQRASDAQAGDCKRLGQPLAQRSCRAGMAALQLDSQSVQPIDRLVVVFERPCLTQPTFD